MFIFQQQITEKKYYYKNCPMCSLNGYMLFRFIWVLIINELIDD